MMRIPITNTTNGSSVFAVKRPRENPFTLRQLLPLIANHGDSLSGRAVRPRPAYCPGPACG
ncbi:hypothetical protein NITHO_3310032 [Nitrolancea hollandica Lb]|uniref:Uncharacterized protein n=1 Tax=Nitrolancea hollandica Lb TaxID=1129897 RepID=I4EI03_9BACT|nr:hypothetical protein NITHO_3310032 [Nitrolancea hollandica Lb]